MKTSQRNKLISISFAQNYGNHCASSRRFAGQELCLGCPICRAMESGWVDCAQNPAMLSFGLYESSAGALGFWHVTAKREMLNPSDVLIEING